MAIHDTRWIIITRMANYEATLSLRSHDVQLGIKMDKYETIILTLKRTREPIKKITKQI